jgi:hypothetical protein
LEYEYHKWANDTNFIKTFVKFGDFVQIHPRNAVDLPERILELMGRERAPAVCAIDLFSCPCPLPSVWDG